MLAAATAAKAATLPATGAAASGAKATAAATISPQVQRALQNFQFSAHKSALALNYPWLTHAFAAIFVCLAVTLVFLLAIQTTKQEGLSGTIGGRVESAYRPRLGFDQQLQRITGIVAISFVIFGTFVSLSGI